jgi:hypothetical protein
MARKGDRPELAPPALPESVTQDGPVLKSAELRHFAEPLGSAEPKDQLMPPTGLGGLANVGNNLAALFSA